MAPPDPGRAVENKGVGMLKATRHCPPVFVDGVEANP